VLMGCLLAVFTAVLSRIKRPETESWILLAGFYVAMGSIWWANESVLKYNRSGQPVEIGPVLIVVLLSVCAVLGAVVASKRGFELRGGAVMAEEVHAAPHWAFIFLFPLLIEVAAIRSIPNTAVRIGLALSALLFLLIVSGALSGFHYVFTSSGLEIRTLGFRLRSIPREHIKAYAPARWNRFCGYGIRGIGDHRAYVWGNKGVRIETTEGEVFLGHAEPGTIVRDLDLVKAARTQ
jgi:hypothetical protein